MRLPAQGTVSLDAQRREALRGTADFDALLAAREHALGLDVLAPDAPAADVSAVAAVTPAAAPVPVIPPVPPTPFADPAHARDAQPPSAVAAALPAPARHCPLPDLHAGWWFARQTRTAEGSTGAPGPVEVVCGLCEYPGISPHLRAILTDPPAPAGERATLSGELLAGGAAHDWPRGPLASSGGPGCGTPRPFLGLCAGEAHWRVFMAHATLALLRQAVTAALIVRIQEV